MVRKRKRQRHTTETSFGTAVLTPVGETGWQLTLARSIQSLVDPYDPWWMPCDYFWWSAATIEGSAGSTVPPRLLHLGGAAMTMPRYVYHNHPGSSQVVIEIESTIIDLVNEHVPLPPHSDIEVRIGDAYEVLPTLPDNSFDLVIGDAFAGDSVPESMSNAAHIAEVSRVLTPTGTYVLNIFDSLDLNVARAQTAALTDVFADWRLVNGPIEVGYLRRLNFVCAATNSDDGIAVDKITAAGRNLSLELMMLPAGSHLKYFDSLSSRREA